jgi:hypothetical protein
MKVFKPDSATSIKNLFPYACKYMCIIHCIRTNSSCLLNVMASPKSYGSLSFCTTDPQEYMCGVECCFKFRTVINKNEKCVSALKG